MKQNAIQGREDLNEEHIAQSARLRLMPIDGFVKLDLGNIEESNRHGRYLAMMAPRSFAGISPRR